MLIRNSPPKKKRSSSSASAPRPHPNAMACACGSSSCGPKAGRYRMSPSTCKSVCPAAASGRNAWSAKAWRACGTGPAGAANPPCPPLWSDASSKPPAKPRPPGLAGAGAQGPPISASRTTRGPDLAQPEPQNPTSSAPLNSPAVPSSMRSSGMGSACTSTRPRSPWCSAAMRKRGAKPSNARSPASLGARASPRRDARFHPAQHDHAVRRAELERRRRTAKAGRHALDRLRSERYPRPALLWAQLRL